MLFISGRAEQKDFLRKLTRLVNCCKIIKKCNHKIEEVSFTKGYVYVFIVIIVILIRYIKSISTQNLTTFGNHIWGYGRFCAKFINRSYFSFPKNAETVILPLQMTYVKKGLLVEVMTQSKFFQIISYNSYEPH